MGTMSLRVVAGTQGAAECEVRASDAAPSGDVRIDGWLVQPSLNMLTRDDVHVRLRPQLMDLLMCLAGNPGAVVTPEELVAVVWDGRWIAASGISRCIAELRSALGDDARKPRVIETITKRGYRLIAPVRPAVACAAVPQPSFDDPTAAGSRLPPGTGTLWRRIERAARLLVWRSPQRAFRT